MECGVAPPRAKCKGWRAETVSSGLTTHWEEKELRRSLGQKEWVLRSPKLGPGTARERDRERACMLSVPQSCPGWQLGGAGRGERRAGGVLPSWKRPCLIVPD